MLKKNANVDLVMIYIEKSSTQFVETLHMMGTVLYISAASLGEPLTSTKNVIN